MNGAQAGGQFQPTRLRVTKIYYIDTSLYYDIMTVERCQLIMKSNKAKLTSLPALEQAAECLRTLAHPHRLRMVQMLLRGRYTVGELADECGIASHMASEHLRLMQRSGFLTSEKDGRKTFYQIAEPHLAGILSCVEKRFDSAGS